MCVLVVDDERDICTMICRILVGTGVDCHASHSLEEAMEEIQNCDFHLYLIDINLPDGNGFELVPVILGKDPKARVVLISAHDDVMNKQKAADMGVEHFVSKPFSKDDIVSLIQN